MPVTALALLMPLSACGGGDDKADPKDDSTAQITSGTGEVAGGKTPDTLPPGCPFSEKQLDKTFDVALKTVKGQRCAFESPKGQARISVTLTIAADNESYDTESGSFKDWDNYKELDDVDGQGYVAWTDNELNITIGYLDNAGAYRYQVSGIAPDDAGADDAVDLAEKLIDLTVASRKS
jgi:hypothetical protein